MRRALPMMLALAAALPPRAARADDETPKPDKSGYTLVNPTPNDELREFSTDRPGKSHSTSTVDAGHVQIESDIVNATINPHGVGGVSTQSDVFGAPLFKLGLTNWLDFEVGLSLFNSVRQYDPSAPRDMAVTRTHGFGDTFFNAKINVFGNDGGDQSFALLPSIKAPTAAANLGNGYVEYALNAPFITALPHAFSLTLEPAFGVVRNDASTRYVTTYGFIANLNRQVLVDGLTAALEGAVNYSTDRRQGTQVSIDPSLQYLLTKNLQLDAGVYFGVTKVTPRYNPYVGISYRF